MNLNQFKGDKRISLMRCKSSLIASLEISPLYTKIGNPSSMSFVLNACFPSLYSKIATGNLSVSTKKNLLFLTMISYPTISLINNRMNFPSFVESKFNSLILSASDLYMTFSACRWLKEYIGVCEYFVLSRFACFGAVFRPIQNPIPKTINIKIKFPMITPFLLGAL